MASTDDFELLARYLADDLAPAERAEVERQLAERADWREAVAQLQGLDRAVALLPASTSTPGERAALADAALASRERASPRFAVLAAAAVMVLGVGWYALNARSASVEVTVLSGAPSLNDQRLAGISTHALSAGDRLETHALGALRLASSDGELWLTQDSELLAGPELALRSGTAIVSGDQREVIAGGSHFHISGQAIISMEPEIEAPRVTEHFEAERYVKSRSVKAAAVVGVVAVTLFVLRGSVEVKAASAEKTVVSAPGTWSSKTPSPAQVAQSATNAPAGASPIFDETMSASDGLLEVHVTGAGKPVGAANVRLYRLAGRDSASGQNRWHSVGAEKTNQNGVASLAAKPGAYAVAISAQGWPLTIKDAQRHAGQDRTKAEIVLEAGSVLHGRTEDSRTHQPVVPATIELRQQHVLGLETLTLAVDTTGRFTTPPLAPGEWQLVGIAEGQGSASLGVTMPQLGEAKVVFRASGFVEGYVQWPDGGAAAGAQVTLVGDDTITTEASASGAFSVEAAPGSWRARARVGALVGNAPQPAQVRNSGTSSVGVIRLGAAASLHGTVTSGKKPVVGATIQVSPHRGMGELGKTESNASGGYSIDLPTGTYDIGVLIAGNDEHDELGVVVSGDTKLDMTVPPKGAIHGKYVEDDGTPITDGVIKLVRPFQTGSRTTLSQGGEFTFEAVSAGQWVVSAPREGETLAASARVTVTAGQTAEVELRHVRPTLLKGTVKWSCDGEPRPGEVQVSPAIQANTVHGSTVFGVDMHFEAQVAPGEYEVFAGAMKGCYGLAHITARAGETTNVEITVAHKKGPTDIIVLERTGEPSVEAMVVVSDPKLGANSTNNFIAMCKTDETGACNDGWNGMPQGPFNISVSNGDRVGEVKGVKPGTKSVTVTLSDSATLDITLQGLPPDEQATVQMTASSLGYGDQITTSSPNVHVDSVASGRVTLSVASQTKSGTAEINLKTGEHGAVTVVLVPGATVSGRLVTMKGAPRAGYIGLLTLQGDETGRSVMVDDSGKFELRNVAPGSYQLGSLGESATMPIKIEAGQTLDVGDFKSKPDRR